MKNFKSFEIQGPFEALKKLPKSLLEQTKPIHAKVYGKNEGMGVVVALYEEFQKPNNTSLSVSLMIEMAASVMTIDIIESGGKQGFSGNYLSEYKSVYETLVDFTVEYGKKHGLSIMDKSNRLAPKQD
jgi:hypothetical protein